MDQEAIQLTILRVNQTNCASTCVTMCMDRYFWLRFAGSSTFTSLIYIGSGCLFRYSDEHPVGSNPFTEEDTPNYTWKLLFSCQGLHRQSHAPLHKCVLNVWMRLPVSWDASHRNLITKMISYKKILNVPNSVTVLPELLLVLLKPMKKRQPVESWVHQTHSDSRSI